MIGFAVFILPVVLAVLVTISLAKPVGVLGASRARYAWLKLLMLDGVMLMAVSFFVSLFIFNPTRSIIGGALTFQDHFNYAIWNAGFMSLLVIPGTLLAFKAGRDASRSGLRNGA